MSSRSGSIHAPSSSLRPSLQTCNIILDSPASKPNLLAYKLNVETPSACKTQKKNKQFPACEERNLKIPPSAQLNEILRSVCRQRNSRFPCIANGILRFPHLLLLEEAVNYCFFVFFFTEFRRWTFCRHRGRREAHPCCSPRR